MWRDLPRWPDWQPSVLEVHWLRGEPWEVGSTFTLLRQEPFKLLRRIPALGSRRFTGNVRSTSDEQLLVWELKPTSAAWFGPTLVQSVRLEPAPSGTTVHLTITAHGPSTLLSGPLLDGALHNQAEAALAGLRRELAPVERRQ
jgi:hypothetical protein